MFEKKSVSKYIPKDISPKDDAYHITKKLISEEWWYFDAIFDNNYSLHTDFTTATKGNQISSSSIEIYKEGNLEVKAIKRHLFQPFQVSKDFPLVQLFDNKIINFDLERFNKTGEWVYNFTQRLEDCEVNLTFVGTTKGWKIVTDDLSWTVALPKAIVTGEMTVNGTKMKVNGIGYHDHNWNSTMSTIFKLCGWYWGKITSRTFNVTWAYLMRNRSQGDLIAVVNKDNQGYFSINPENIYFKREKFIKSHGRKIPSQLTLQIKDIIKDVPISADITMKIKNMHFKSLKVALCYWRYHIKTEGLISIGSYTEQVNDTHIMEFFRFA